jgi:hypothetical protein
LIDHDNLEEFADAESYDIEDDSDTGVAFYTSLAQETGGPVLEIACGTGRVGIPIARLVGQRYARLVYLSAHRTVCRRLRVTVV